MPRTIPTTADCKACLLRADTGHQRLAAVALISAGRRCVRGHSSKRTSVTCLACRLTFGATPWLHDTFVVVAVFVFVVAVLSVKSLVF